MFRLGERNTEPFIMTKKETSEQIGRYSKHKGDRGEREVAKMLGSFFLDDENAFARFGNEVAGRIPGDVGIFIKNNMSLTTKLWEVFPFSFEVKNREDWFFESLVNNPKHSTIIQFWKQAVDEAERFKKVPFLIIKKNRHPFYGIIDPTLAYDKFGESLTMPYIYITSTIYPTCEERQVSKRKYLLAIFKLEDFIEMNRCSVFVSKLKEMYKLLIEREQHERR